MLLIIGFCAMIFVVSPDIIGGVFVLKILQLGPCNSDKFVDEDMNCVSISGNE